MKKEELPQDPSSLNKYTKEVCYVVDETGNYTTGLSSGWDVKISALDVTWNDIETKTADAGQKVISGEVSPVFYYMQLRVMDLEIISAYTGFWQWQIKRHFKPEVFKNLSDKKLQKYASLFEVSLEELKHFKK
ncbi:MAG: hypothetical protein H7329_04655 [Opitutaceae bacterium]|nr:hypothetical protein [Cytophagales bacterium]